MADDIPSKLWLRSSRQVLEKRSLLHPRCSEIPESEKRERLRMIVNELWADLTRETPRVRRIRHRIFKLDLRWPLTSRQRGPEGFRIRIEPPFDPRAVVANDSGWAKVRLPSSVVILSPGETYPFRLWREDVDDWIDVYWMLRWQRRAPIPATAAQPLPVEVVNKEELAAAFGRPIRHKSAHASSSNKGGRPAHPAKIVVIAEIRRRYDAGERWLTPESTRQLRGDLYEKLPQGQRPSKSAMHSYVTDTLADLKP
jgi:hypothetical protein